MLRNENMFFTNLIYYYILFIRYNHFLNVMLPICISYYKEARDVECNQSFFFDYPTQIFPLVLNTRLKLLSTKYLCF